ncbi:MAG TPA: DUF255 domain-containing protein [Saprospiraceae bacterium]|nr:DUF255 domain-containing protein [Saprospiraceae bacterium]
MRILIFSLLFLMITCGIHAQIIRLEGNVIDQNTQSPIPFVEVYDQNDELLSFGNKEGEFSIMIEFSDTIVTLKHPEYKSVRMNTRQLTGIPVRMEKADQSAGTITGDLSSEQLLHSIRNSIEANTLDSTHILIGYYSEKSKDNQEIFHNYGEGVIRTMKYSYRNSPDLDWAFQMENEEFVGLDKGFYKDFLINMGDEGSQDYFPALNTAMLLPKTHDFLKTSLSPLMEENLRRYRFQIEGKVLQRENPAYVVHFQPTDSLRRMEGSFLVDQATSAVVQADYKVYMDARRQKAMSSSRFQMDSEKVHIRYLPYGDRWIPGLIVHTTDYIYTPTSDRIRLLKVYATTGVQKDSLDVLDRVTSVASRTRIESVIPSESNVYFFGMNTIPRTRDVRNLVENVELIIDRRDIQPIVFYNDKYSKILDFARAQRKHVLIDFYADWSEANTEMDYTTYMQPNVIRAVNKNFIAYKVDVVKEKKHPVLRELFVDVVPAFVIVSPLGQILTTKTGYMFEDTFLEFLGEASRIDAGKLVDAFESVSGAQSRKIAAADKALFEQLKDDDMEGAVFYLEKYLTETNNWNDPVILNFIFEHLMTNPESFYASLLGNERDYYIEHYGMEKYTSKLNELALLYFQGNMNDPRRYERYIRSQDRELTDSLTGLFNMDYYGRVVRDERRYVEAVIAYYNEFDHHRWDDAKSRLLTAIIFTDHNRRLRELMDILQKFEASAKDYERLDLESVIHYKLGDQEKALLMIEEIRKLAYKEGVNYQVALRRLVEE